VMIIMVPGIFFVPQQPYADQGRLIVDVTRSHTHTEAFTRVVGLL